VSTHFLIIILATGVGESFGPSREGPHVRKGRKERKSIYIAPFILRIVAKRSDMDHTVLPANYTMPAFPS